MKQVLLLLITCCLSAPTIAQEAEYEATMIRFMELYNENNGQAVFDMMDPTMQGSISLKQISSIVDSFQKSFGKMTSYEFAERKGIVEVYRCEFIQGVQNVSIVANSEEKLTGLLFKPVDNPREARFNRNSTAMQLPFKGEWFTVWGGTEKRQNYHVAFTPQQGAFDFLILNEKDKSYTRSGTRNEDYYAFGKPLYAICDAEVYEIGTGVEDNRPTQMNPAQALGNYVVLKTANDEYIFYAHFQKETIKVKKGDVVKQGQLLGNCGNSGNSSEPHLHLHIQDGPNVMADIGARCFFDSIMVNGSLEKDYSPVKGDRISRPAN